MSRVRASAFASVTCSISRKASSGVEEMSRWIARWNRPCAVPWLVIVSMPLGRRLTLNSSKAVPGADVYRRQQAALRFRL
jgi:hypothetical protein